MLLLTIHVQKDAPNLSEISKINYALFGRHNGELNKLKLRNYGPLSRYLNPNLVHIAVARSLVPCIVNNVGNGTPFRQSMRRRRSQPNNIQYHMVLNSFLVIHTIKRSFRCESAFSTVVLISEMKVVDSSM